MAPAAQDTLGGALVAAGHLPRRVGSELLVVAQEAFTRGLRIAVIVAAIIAAAMAVLVLALLKRVRPSSAVGAQLASADRSIAGS
jgi:DHA2 family multidrug resistance protein-like MFS transporter